MKTLDFPGALAVAYEDSYTLRLGKKLVEIHLYLEIQNFKRKTDRHETCITVQCSCYIYNISSLDFVVIYIS